MPSRAMIVAGAGLAALAIAVCVTAGLWSRPLSMDNRLYFYISERAASGVAPHVSTPDGKNQLATLADAASIRAGRAFGLNDVRAGRIGTLAILILGVWGIGCSVHALGATRTAATLAAISVFAFSNLSGHTTVGFNPKILMFTMLAWGPWFLARERYAGAGAVAAAAMCCWQPAATACLGAALGALTTARPLAAFVRVVAGGVAFVALYEAYFAWHGVLLAQLFQAYGLPLGSASGEMDWMSGIRFVLFGSRQGIDRFAIPAVCFLVFLAGSVAAAFGTKLPPAGRSPAPASAICLLAVAGTLMLLFTMYEHHAEPDRFLLVAYYAIAVGVVADRLFHFARTRIHERTAHQLQGALAAAFLLCAPRSVFVEGKRDFTLESQIDAGRTIALAAEAYGTVWAYGCIHLMGLAHVTNFHPIDHFWDDLRRYVDETTFVPVVRGRMPDVIVLCRRVPGGDASLEGYTEIPSPRVEENIRLFARREAVGGRVVSRSPGAERRNKGLWKRRERQMSRVAPDARTFGVELSNPATSAPRSPSA